MCVSIGCFIGTLARLALPLMPALIYRCALPTPVIRDRKSKAFPSSTVSNFYFSFAPPSKGVKYRITYQSLDEAFWRTLICEFDLQGRKPDSSCAEMHECVRRFHDTWNDSEQFLDSALAPHTYEEYQRLSRRYEFYGREKRFFSTSMEFVGWVPKRSQVGDHAFVFPGAKLFYIIRWEVDTYELISPAYVHGLT
jgi:hypothetical protein